MDGPPVDPLLMRVAAAFVGAVGGVVYFKPRSIRDALARLVFSVAAGVVFGFVPVEMLGWSATPEHRFAGHVLMAFASWPVAGVVSKWISARAGGG